MCQKRQQQEEDTTGQQKRKVSRTDVADRKKRQQQEEFTTVKCTVNRLGMRELMDSDGDKKDNDSKIFRERLKCDAARLQEISFIGTRFAQFVLLSDLEKQKNRFDPTDAQHVSEQTFWQQCLNAVTNHGEKTYLDKFFREGFKDLLPDDWKPVESKLTSNHISNLRNQLMTNAETMIATTFHRRIREGLHLQLLTSKISKGINLKDTAD